MFKTPIGVRINFRRLLLSRVPLRRSLLEGAAIILAAALFYFYVPDDQLRETDVALISLLPVLWLAARQTPLVALVLTGLIALAVNYYYFPPLHSFGFNSSTDLLSFCLYVLVAGALCFWVARFWTQYELTQQHLAMVEISRQRLALLHDLRRLVLVVSDPQQLRETIRTTIESALGRRIALVKPSGGIIDLSSTAEGLAGWTLVPLGERRAEWLAIDLTQGRPALASKEFLADMSDLVSISFDRADFIARDAAALQERERLRNTILTSVGHDLRTPLGSIIGSATTLQDVSAALGPETSARLLENVVESAEILTWRVDRLLAMVRLDSGVVAPRLEWLDLIDVIGTAADRATSNMAAANVRVIAPDEMPLLRSDHVMLEAVVINLVENAVKFSVPGTLVEVAVKLEDDEVCVTVRNQGPQLDPAQCLSVFDKFNRVQFDRNAPGSGLGLAICKGFIESLGGTIVARPTGDGMAFSFFLPLDEQDPS